MLKDRLVTGFIAAVMLIAVLLASDLTLQIAVLVITILILLELYKALGLTRKRALMVLGLIPPVFVFLSRTVDMSILLYVYIILMFAALIVFHEDISFRDVASVFMASLFVTFFLWHIVMVRQIEEHGRYLIWAVFIGSCLSDTFAYLVGNFMGSHRLAPKISPKKTVEGAIGGILGTVISFLVYGLILNKGFSLEVNINGLWMLGVLSSIVSQIGDLTASIIKRESGIKDFGAILPGHGGVLDRFDSIMFAAPMVYYFVTMFPIIVS